jgi:hypothetical protein
MKNISKKLLSARKHIAETPLKKGGRNTYSNYDYFTPSQVSELVTKACQENKLLTQYSLINTEYGFHGKLTVTDIESGEQLEFTMATAMPEITATNAAQKLGGMATFNERYLKMSVFEIVDNNLDFDAHDNREKPTPKEVKQPEKKAVTAAQYEAMLKAIASGNKEAVKARMQLYTFTDEQTKQLNDLLK